MLSDVNWMVVIPLLGIFGLETAVTKYKSTTALEVYNYSNCTRRKMCTIMVYPDSYAFQKVVEDKLYWGNRDIAYEITLSRLFGSIKDDWSI
jgi:hypothetical protein